MYAVSNICTYYLIVHGNSYISSCTNDNMAVFISFYTPHILNICTLRQVQGQETDVLQIVHGCGVDQQNQSPLLN